MSIFLAKDAEPMDFGCRSILGGSWRDGFFLDGQAIGKTNISTFSQSIAEAVNFELGSVLEGHWAI